VQLVVYEIQIPAKLAEGLVLPSAGSRLRYCFCTWECEQGCNGSFEITFSSAFASAFTV